jgi:hypothetical protein
MRACLPPFTESRDNDSSHTPEHFSPVMARHGIPLICEAQQTPRAAYRREAWVWTLQQPT